MTVALATRRPLLPRLVRWRPFPYIALFAVALVGTLFLGATVHHRGTENLYRDGNVIMPWLEQGYFYLGGQRWLDGTVKATYSWFYLFGAYLLELVNYSLTGEFSYRLLALHNQIVLMLSGFAVGVLAFCCSIRLWPRRLDALAFAVAAMCVYLTFPWNLAGYFRIYPTNVWMIWAALFLTLTLRELDDRKVDLKARHYWAKGVLVFLMFYTEHIASLFLLSSLLPLSFFLRRSYFGRARAITTIVVPALLAIALFIAGLIYIVISFPGVEWSGSTLLFRTGLDGSTVYYTTHLDLLRRNSYLPVYLEFGHEPHRLSRWYALLGFGCAAFAYFIFEIGISRYGSRRLALQVVFVAVGALALQYILFAAFLSNAAITHPFGYDHYFAAPLIVAAFAVLPALLMQRMPYPRLLPLAVLVLGFIWTMVQLRLFAIVFPTDV